MTGISPIPSFGLSEYPHALSNSIAWFVLPPAKLDWVLA